MRYTVIPDGIPGYYIVTILGTQEVFGTFDNKQDATELAEYLNGGTKVPSYMEEKEVV
jgi:hypothetical protein